MKKLHFRDCTETLCCVRRITWKVACDHCVMVSYSYCLSCTAMASPVYVNVAMPTMSDTHPGDVQGCIGCNTVAC